MKTVKITAQPALKADGSVNANAGKVFTLAVNADGSPKLDKNGDKHGFIRVEQRELNLGFAYSKATKSRSSLIAMTEKSFQADASEMKAGTSVNGQIVRKDSLKPSYPTQKPVQFPKRDENGKIIEGQFTTLTSGGAPVYRTEVFTADQNATDELLSYDKVEVVAPAKAGKAIA